jgi:GGDEF domain-containing protein
VSTKSTGSEATPVIFTARHQRLASDSGSFVVIAGSELGRRYPLPASEARIGRVSINEIVVDDRSISRTHARVFPTPEGFVLEDLASTNGLLVNEIATTRRLLRDGDIIRLGRTVLKFLTNTNLEVDYHTEVYKLSTTDALSGCYNKRYLINQLERDLSRALRYKRSLSVLLFDIDHFKLLNDTLGHIAGDAALVTVAQRVRDVIRRADTLARYGVRGHRARGRRPAGHPHRRKDPTVRRRAATHRGQRTNAAHGLGRRCRHGELRGGHAAPRRRSAHHATRSAPAPAPSGRADV